jgi:hypothetical protein
MQLYHLDTHSVPLLHIARDHHNSPWFVRVLLGMRGNKQNRLESFHAPTAPSEQHASLCSSRRSWLQVCLTEQARERKREATAAAALERRLAPFRQVAALLRDRGYRCTRPQFGLQARRDVTLPRVLDGCRLHFSAAFFYPEAMPYHDTVEDCCENDPIDAHLDSVLLLATVSPSVPCRAWVSGCSVSAA